MTTHKYSRSKKCNVCHTENCKHNEIYVTDSTFVWHNLMLDLSPACSLRQQKKQLPITSQQHSP